MEQFNIGDHVSFWYRLPSGTMTKVTGTVVDKPDWRTITVSFNTKDEDGCPISGLARLRQKEIIDKL